MLNIFSLEGKVAAVTGSTRGIGHSLAISLAEAGADIALLQRDTTNVKIKKEIEEIGRKAEIIPCDLNDEQQVRKAIPKTIEKFSSIDILVNNGGIQRRSPATCFPNEYWDEIMMVNLKAAWILAQEAGKFMVNQKSGKIINTASLNAFQGGINIPAYASAKGGVAQLTKALSNEWASKNVNVNAIVPGYVATDMNQALIEDKKRSQEILSRIPANRWGSPEDFKGAIIYLASSASNYVHGHLLTIDGGWMGR